MLLLKEDGSRKHYRYFWVAAVSRELHWAQSEKAGASGKVERLRITVRPESHFANWWIQAKAHVEGLLHFYDDEPHLSMDARDPEDDPVSAGGSPVTPLVLEEASVGVLPTPSFSESWEVPLPVRRAYALFRAFQLYILRAVFGVRRS